MIEIKRTKVPESRFVRCDIYLTRGDSAYLDCDVKDRSGKPITLGSEDNLHIQVREAPDGGNVLFEGQVESDGRGLVWHILPEQTKTAPKSRYYWDAQIEFSNGDVFTWIPASEFVLTPEVTEKDREG